MVDNVILNDVVQQVLSYPAKIAVNGGSSTLKEGPGFVLIFRNLRMCMV